MGSLSTPGPNGRDGERSTPLRVDETPAHTRPRAIQGKPVEPKVHGAFAVAVETLDVADEVTACDPLDGDPRRKTTGPFRVSASGPPAMEPVPDTSGKLLIPWAPLGLTARRGCGLDFFASLPTIRSAAKTDAPPKGLKRHDSSGPSGALWSP